MRAVIQRVTGAQIVVDGNTVSQIGPGMVVLAGFVEADGAEDLVWMARKLAGLRIFADGQGKMNLSIGDVNGKILVVPNFTLYADVSRGRRPSFAGAAGPEVAEQLFDEFVTALCSEGVPVAQGIFGASMQVSLTNDGPVTLIIDTESVQ